MKLSELTEAAGPDLEKPGVQASGDWKIPVVTLNSDTRPSERGNQIGKGRQAKVFEFPNKPGTVIKHVSVKEDFKTDVHANFINLAIKHQDNPFFPKIYNAKIYTNKGKFGAEHAPGEKTLVVQMEKLHPMNKSNISDSAQHLLYSIGIDNSKPRGPETEEDPNPINNVQRSMDIDAVLRRAFEDSTKRMEIAENTKNPHLAKAIYALEPLFQSYDNDILIQNLMLRLTSTGPQLVFTDPF